MAEVLAIQISADIASVQANIAKLRQGFTDLASKIKSSGNSAAESMKNATQGAESLAGAVFGGVTAANALAWSLGKIKEAAGQALETYLKMNSAMRVLEYATGAGASAMIFVRKVSNDLGMDLLTTSAAFGKLAASAKGTSLEGKGTEDVFRAVASAATTMGLGAEETNGMIIALGQMLSKGKVMAEELRKQLGERLPGAFQIAARAMGVTTAELDKMLQEGKVIASDFLPKFATELTRTLGDAPQQASMGLQASINRLKTAWTDFLFRIGQAGTMDALATGIVGLTQALQGLGTVVRPVADLLGNAGVQAMALGAGLAILVPWLAKTALVTAMAGAFKALAVNLAIAAISAQTAGVSFAAANLASSFAAAINPITLAVVAIGGAAAAFAYFGQKYSAAARDKAQADAEAHAQATSSVRDFVDQKEKIEDLEKTLSRTTRGSKEHAAAGKELNSIVRGLVSTYPDFLGYLRKEGNEYTNVTASMERYRDSKLKVLRAQLQTAKESKTWALNEAADEDNRNILNWVLFGRSAANNAREEAKAHEQSAKEIEKQIAMLEAWETGKGKDSALANGKKGKDVKPITDEEHKLRLAQWHSELLAKNTLEEQKQLDLEKARLDLAKERERLGQERLEGKLSPQKYAEELGAATSAEKMKEIRILLDTADKRLKLEEELRSKLDAQEEGGLAMRLERVRKHFAAIRKENDATAVNGKRLLTDAEIQEAESQAKGRERHAQVKADLQQLRQELSEMSQIRGPLSNGETLEIMDRFAAKSREAAEAVKQLKAEMHFGAGAKEGMLSGLRDFVIQSQNQFQNWKNATTQILGGVQSSFAGFFESIFKHGMTGSQKWDALWKGIASTVVKALAQMAAQWLVAAIAQKIFQKATASTDAAVISTNYTKAVSESWAAYAGIPFAGAGFAAAQIALITSSLSAAPAVGAGIGAAATARRVGGLVDRPELTLLGEAGPEVVAPLRDFKDWARGFALAGMNLQANLAASREQSAGYRMQAYGYASAAQGQGEENLANGGRFLGAAHYHNHGPIFTRDSREMAEFFNEGRKTWERANA